MPSNSLDYIGLAISMDYRVRRTQKKNQYNPMDYMGLLQHPWTLRAVAFFGLGLGSGCKLMCEHKQLAHLGYDLIFFFLHVFLLCSPL